MSIRTEEPVEDEAETSTVEVVLLSVRLLLTILAGKEGAKISALRCGQTQANITLMKEGM